MKLRITSVTSTEVGLLINDISNNLEDLLKPSIEQFDYGGNIDRFILFFVSVDSDETLNKKYCVRVDKAGRYKNLATGLMEKYVGVAVAVDPAIIVSAEKQDLQPLLVRLMLDKLKTPGYKLPPKFDGDKLFKDIKTLLA